MSPFQNKFSSRMTGTLAAFFLLLRIKFFSFWMTGAIRLSKDSNLAKTYVPIFWLLGLWLLLFEASSSSVKSSLILALSLLVSLQSSVYRFFNNILLWIEIVVFFLFKKAASYPASVFGITYLSYFLKTSQVEKSVSFIFLSSI